MDTITYLYNEEIPFDTMFEFVQPIQHAIDTEEDLTSYCRESKFGSPFFCVAEWEGKPAGIHSVFPFPFLADGQVVTGGHLEFGALHRDIAYRIKRPDIFRPLITKVVEHCEAQKFAFTLGVSTPSALKAHRRAGFKNLDFAFTWLAWPLRGSTFGTDTIKEIAGSGGGIRALLRNGIKLSIKVVTSLLGPVTKGMVRISPKKYALKPFPVGDLESLDEMLRKNFWPERRLTASRDPNFLASRIRPEQCHKLLSITVKGSSDPIGLAILERINAGTFVLDVLPPNLANDRALWHAMIDFADKDGSAFLAARFFENNPRHAESLKVARKAAPAIRRSSNRSIVIQVHDSQYAYAEDPGVWAPDEMLGIGF